MLPAAQTPSVLHRTLRRLKLRAHRVRPALRLSSED